MEGTTPQLDNDGLVVGVEAKEERGMVRFGSSIFRRRRLRRGTVRSRKTRKKNTNLTNLISPNLH